MKFKNEWKIITTFIAVFIAMYALPFESERWSNALLEAFYLAQWYAREHVILCLIPALYIAGAISVFVSQGAVMKYLGPTARKSTAYGVASVSGTILAVCSCTVLPLFAGIYGMGAGLGPATTFLYSGPAINVLAIVLTANVLGGELGVARAIGAVVFSIIVGVIMHFLFLKEERQRSSQAAAAGMEEPTRPLWQNAVFFASMVGILVFANWARPEEIGGVMYGIFIWKWLITSSFAVLLGIVLIRWFGIKPWKMAATAAAVILAWYLFPDNPTITFATGAVVLSVFLIREEGEAGDWFEATWDYTKQILPLLFFGVLIAGALLGRPGHDGIIPSEWITQSVGGNSLFANFFASFAGAFMYFATLTEIPILQGLLGNGMGSGPALALLLAGPALSLPNMLVIRSVIGTKKTLAFVTIVIIISTISGLLYGAFA